jgi:hypothetical protein
MKFLQCQNVHSKVVQAHASHTQIHATVPCRQLGALGIGGRGRVGGHPREMEAWEGPSCV